MTDYTHLQLWTSADPATGTHGNYAGEVYPGEYVAYFQHRDSDCLTRSNFTCMLARLGGESETVSVIRTGHWAVGWTESILINVDDETRCKLADDLLEKLSDYPVLNEDHFSELEQEEATETWKNCYDPKERIEYIREHRSQFEFHNFADLMACIRGRYFAGYASELIS